MTNGDRRSGSERRGTNRYPLTIDLEWEGPEGRLSGTLSDVSLDGCFILSSGRVNDGDRVTLFVPLDDGMKVQFVGTVANNVFEIGFGVRFDPLSAGQRDILITLVKEQVGP